MLTLPDEYNTLFEQVQPCFSQRVWQSALVLAVGALLAPGKRTVTAILRIMGLSQERHFQNYHRVLNRAKWSPLELSAILLRLLLHTFLPRGPVVLGIDETIERRRGAKIAAKGIYRDAVRSSKSHFVKTSGLRWISLQLLVTVPWAQRVWALPFLTVLAPSAQFYADTPRSPKKLTDWARQMAKQVRRWLPEREIIVVADSSYAALALLSSLQTLAHPGACGDAVAPRCGIVCTRSPANRPQSRPPPQTRRALAHAPGRAGQPAHGLANGLCR